MATWSYQLGNYTAACTIVTGPQQSRTLTISENGKEIRREEFPADPEDPMGLRVYERAAELQKIYWPRAIEMHTREWQRQANERR
jgi:hypothetical protein